MLKALIRTGIFAGVAYGAYYVARQFWADEIDDIIDKTKSNAKDIVRDLGRKDEAVTSSMEKNMPRKAV